MANIVATYGTLRKTGRLHTCISKNNYIGSHTLSGYDMYSYYDGTKHMYPIVVKGSGNIVVELYEVRDKTLQILDYIELTAGYERVLVDVNGHDAWLYLMPHEHALTGIKIESGDFLDYANERMYQAR